MWVVVHNIMGAKITCSICYKVIVLGDKYYVEIRGDRQRAHPECYKAEEEKKNGGPGRGNQDGDSGSIS